MSVASLGVMFASARIPQIATPLLSLAVVIAAATWVTFQLMSPVASGVRFDVWTILATFATVVLTILPPWKAFVASMIFGVVAAVSTVWQVTQTKVARYLPFVGPATGLAPGRLAGLTGAFCGAAGWTA